MKPVTLLGFGIWFAVCGFLLGIPTGVILARQVGSIWQGLIIFASSMAALIVVRIAVNLKVRMSR